MSRATLKLVLVTWMSSLVFFLACGGQELLNLGGDAGQGTGDGNAAGSGSGGVSSANGNGGGGDGAASIPPGHAVPCGDTVCSAPDVCCVEAELSAMLGRSTGTCEPRASCDGGAVVTCTALTCPAGSLCCVSDVETAQCIEGSSCSSGQLQACVPPAAPFASSEAGPPCPTGDYCSCDYVVCTCGPVPGPRHDGDE